MKIPIGRLETTWTPGFPVTWSHCTHCLSDKADPPEVMLICNYPDARQEAEEAGAVAGIGKSSWSTPDATQRRRDAISG